MRYIPYIMTAFSVAGTIANSFQKKWCFWLWIFTNIFWCGYNVLNTQYAQALLYVFNFAMCIVGLHKWRQKDIKDKLEKYGNRIQCYSPPGYVSRNCVGKKHITDCLKCKYSKYECGAETIYNNQNSYILRGDNVKELVVPPLPEPQTEEPQAERQEVPKEPEDPFERMSNAISEFTSALIDAMQPTIKAFQEAINNFAKNYCGGDYEFLIWQNKHADPKILNRAYNAPKYRTRKKNLSRLKREYKKYIKKRSGGV